MSDNTNKPDNGICIVCGIRPVAYEKVRHCRECHSRYNKQNYQNHSRRLEIEEHNERVLAAIWDHARNRKKAKQVDSGRLF